MIIGIAIDNFYGIRQKRVYTCECEGDGFFPVEKNSPFARYAKGLTKPNYPMPAIALEVWMDHETVLMRRKWYKKIVAHWYKAI